MKMSQRNDGWVKLKTDLNNFYITIKKWKKLSHYHAY